MADPKSIFDLDPARSRRTGSPAEDVGPGATPAFPRFAGPVYQRPPRYHQEVGAHGELDDYTAHAYQYATSSRPGALQPAAIVYCANEADVALAIRYARDAGVAVAVRTGGHHFWGASSTADQNVQVDLSGFRHFSYDAASRTVTCGVGLKLEELDEKLGALGAFVPHGQCGAVRLGGHLQSGGFSVLCGRSFGWFSDHVVSFRIVTADLRTRVVHRPDPARPHVDDELWFAAIGGSPGNFGVVTEMTLRPLWDADHPESRTMTVYLHYTPEAHEALLQIVADFNDDDDLPADFNVCTFILGAHPLVLRRNLDTRMSKERPELYGEGMEPHPTIIGLWATWCNLDGGPFSEEARAFFAELDRRTRPLLSKRDRLAARLLGPLVGKVVPVRTPDEAVPMSELTDAYCFPKRVHANPYVSATWCGRSQQTARNGFARWARDATAEVEAQPGCYPDFEWVVCGGRHSRNRPAGDAHSAVAWRDVTMLCFQYVHFDVTDHFGRDWGAPRAFSEAWIDRTKRGAVGPDGVLGPDDRRWNAFPEQDEDLDQERAHYFQSEEVYQRVLAVKRAVDPDDVFTANRFCVGASRKYGQGRAAAVESA